MYYLSFLIGLAQGPAWPTIGKLLKAWMPSYQLASWWAIISAGGNVAGALGPFIAASIAINYHWSYGFMIPGCVCMSFGYLAIIILRNKPSDINLPDLSDESSEAKDKKVNTEASSAYSEEKNEEYENESDKGDESDEENRWTLITRLLNFSFFVTICVAFFKAQLVKTLFTDWAQMYLTITLKFDPYEASYFVSTFECFGLIGSILTSLFTDYAYCYLKSKSLKNQEINSKTTSLQPIDIRMSLIRFYFLLMLFTLHLFNYHVDKSTRLSFLLIIGALAGFLCYSIISLLGVIAMEFVPNTISGTSHAIASLAGNIGAIFAGIPFGILSKHYTWNGAFKIVESMLLISVIYLFYNRNSKSKFLDSEKQELKQKQN